jgi:hypothetical protein
MDADHEFFEALLWTALKQIYKNEESLKNLFNETRIKIYDENDRSYYEYIENSDFDNYNRLSYLFKNTFNNSKESKVFLQNHRYANEFDEELILGRGTFGIVYKVKNKIDCQHYAVKKQIIDGMFKCI